MTWQYLRAGVRMLLFAATLTFAWGGSTDARQQDVMFGQANALPVPTAQVLPEVSATLVDSRSPQRVDLEVVVGVDGRVTHAIVVNGTDDQLSMLSVDALRRWLFEPRRRPTLIDVRLDFRSSDDRDDRAEVTAHIDAPTVRSLPPESPWPDVVPLGTRGLTNPKLIRRLSPSYPQAALTSQIAGDVRVEVVVLADGSVGFARVVKSLDVDSGLDDAARRAAAYWLFEPAQLNGQSVAVPLMIDFSFGADFRTTN